MEELNSNNYIEWLRERSMLLQAQRLGRTLSGTGSLWRRPFSSARPRDAVEKASVWFTAYPASIITTDTQSILQTLADDSLWEAMEEIGIEAMHTGPMKLSGGIVGTDATPTTDGHFDRIGLSIDQEFGTSDDYVHLCDAAARHGAVIIDDIIPGHTGKGPDFRLAEYGVGDYPGIYHMVEIAPQDWPLLPAPPEGRDSANLMPETVDILREKGYIVGRLPRVIFYEPGVKESNWSATPPVRGVDGIERRWVYLHYFKEGQPSLNWLDPSFAGPRLVIGDAVHSLTVLRAGMLRLDANGFLGIEPRPNDDTAWSEGHPLSVTANQLIAGMVRKMGGFTFQEVNLAVDDIAAMSNGGADLSYDFITRPAYHYTLVTGDTEFLRLMLRTVHTYDIDPISLVHALQNHDELTLELVHFLTIHKNDEYSLGGQSLKGSELRERIRNTMHGKLTGNNAPYNLLFSNGVACTTTSFIAASIGYSSLEQLSVDQIEQIRRIHLLLCMYNAFQPGVFALSGWDLVGALPLCKDSVDCLIADGDTRWINRGSYDLMDVAPNAKHSNGGLPRAGTLYGSLRAQLSQPESFASQLRKILDARKRMQVFAARQIDIPDVSHPALLVMVHKLPNDNVTQFTALNFGQEPLEECLRIDGVNDGQFIDVVGDRSPIHVDSNLGTINLKLDSYEGGAFVHRK